MKVYLAYWCNNEDYEDYYESIERVWEPCPTSRARAT